MEDVVQVGLEQCSQRAETVGHTPAFLHSSASSSSCVVFLSFASELPRPRTSLPVLILHARFHDCKSNPRRSDTLDRCSALGHSLHRRSRSCAVACHTHAPAHSGSLPPLRVLLRRQTQDALASPSRVSAPDISTKADGRPGGLTLPVVPDEGCSRRPAPGRRRRRAVI